MVDQTLDRFAEAQGRACRDLRTCQQDGATETQLRHSPNPSYVPEYQWSIKRLVGSIMRKATLVSIYEPRIFARLEFQRIERWLNR
jgi:hypothetical protein